MSLAPEVLGPGRAGTGTVRETVRLAGGVELREQDGVAGVSRDGRSLPVRDVGLLAALHDGVEPRLLTRSLEQAGDIVAVLRTRAALTALDGAGFLDRQIHDDDELVAVLHPMAVGPTALVELPGSWTAAPFVSAAVRDGMLVLQAAAGPLEVLLPAASAARWLQLGSGAAPVAADTALLRALATAGVLDSTPPSPAAQWWSAREWAFHRQSRDPAVSRGFAGTMRHAGLRARIPAWAPPRQARRLGLRRPDLARRRVDEPAFVDLVEERRSRRMHDDEHPITVDALAELLYRTVRVTQQATAGALELVRRPVPAGGSLHELEVIAVVNRCDGVDPGAWLYDHAGHQLVHVAEPGPATERLLAAAGSAVATSRPPQVLLILAARFGRLMEKYEAMAYSLVLKDVGVVMHALQLTAEAMRLAACPIGAGQAGDFERLTGADPFEFGAVGELGIGSRGVDDVGSWG